MLHHISVESRLLKAVKHKGVVELSSGVALSLDCLLDSGALHSSYIRKSFVVDNIDILHTHIRPQKSQVSLADKNTIINIEEVLEVPVTFKGPLGEEYMVEICFMIMESLGEEAIVGLPILVGPLLPLFVDSLKSAANNLADNLVDSSTKLSAKSDANLSVIIEKPWTFVDETAIEDDETPLPCAFTDPLYFLTVSRQEALDDFHALFDTHIDPRMLAETDIVNLLKEFDTVFVPVKWSGVLGMEPLEFNWKEGMPQKMMPKARSVNPKLMENARKEFERLRTYFYIPSTSPVASCLVIAPKATAPHIRFCGDYATMINHWMETGHYPIPHVFRSLEKISKFKVFVDLDMSNSFHQFPLAEKTRRLLSIQTPWGQFEPLFLPEGVPPASGVLQKFVYEVFADFQEWTIVIFDNFLILANDHQDAFEKLALVLARCKERNMVLKFAKSWIGFESCEFFGYKCSYQSYCLTDKRKESILKIPMPISVKGMQSFLGCALFFSKFVPNYSERTAPLHDMTHKNFVWEKSTWKKDYQKIFENFKLLLLEAVSLYYPDYDQPWILRVDASDLGVGFVLLQLVDDVLRPILFGSKKFSEQAMRWDTFNKEAFALYYGVKECEYYLRPVHFTLEGDHRNLAWMEASIVPKVIRWRVYLQGFSFVFNHIAGKKNVVADWQSRLFALFFTEVFSADMLPNTQGILKTSSDQQLSHLSQQLSNNLAISCQLSHVSSESAAAQGSAPDVKEEIMHITRDDMLRTVHGGMKGRSGHFGVRKTWMLLNEKFPGHGISYAQITDWILACGICQKIRLGMSQTLIPIVRHLKTTGPRRVAGIDFLSLEPDDYGMIGVYVVRDHFTKILFISAAKEQSAVNAATALFLYSVYYGCFDYLMSDPGSEFTSAVLEELNSWYGIHHRVSLTDRHESNGVEGANKEILRHIRAFLCETRLKRRWSEPNVIGWCTFLMNKFNDSETGISPYTLLFGSDSARHFKIPTSSLNPTTASAYLKALDADLEIVREFSSRFQAGIAEKRTGEQPKQNLFQKGDYVLFAYPVDKPLPSKLNGKYAGPFEVISHVKNEVSCRHCATGKVSEFYSGDLKLFVGDSAEAIRLAMIDADQFQVDSILAYKGNPMLRTSMEFLVRFSDKQEIWIPWSEDLFDTVQYEEFVRLIPPLFPLLLRVRETNKEITRLNKSPIVEIEPGNSALIDIRCYGDSWYDALPIPDKHLNTYVVKHTFGKLSSNATKIDVTCAPLNRSFTADHLFVKQYCLGARSRNNLVEIDAKFITEHPSLLNPEVQERSASDYQYLVGKTYIDDEDLRTYEVTKVYVNVNKFIVANVKWVRKPYSTSKPLSTPIHIADVERMFIASGAPPIA
jgi:hypothetical protein